jgi:general secretion pathway protein H
LTIKHLNPSGFTLIEILIVMIIISIVSTVAMLSIHTNRLKNYELLAEGIIGQLNLAEEEAVLRPNIMGFSVFKNHWEFYLYQTDPTTKKNFWQKITTGALRPHTFDTATQITIQRADTAKVPEDSPQILLFRSGEITPFKLLIGKKDQTPHYEVNGQPTGELSYALFHTPN